MSKNAYAQSGVDVEAGYEVVERIKKACSAYGACGCHGELLVALVACLTFQKQVSKSLY